MSKDRFWRALSIDCINPELFPKVSLFLKSGGNYVLYKSHEHSFTEADRRRLERSFTEFIYVRTGDMQTVNDYLDASLNDVLARDDLSSEAKGNILYQSSVNCVVDMFEAPELAANLSRSRTLIKHLLDFVASDPNALKSLGVIAANNLYIFSHSVQVAALCLLFHEKHFNLPPDELLDVGIGSLLHDYGMTFISSDVMDKPDALSKIEYYKVKQHAQLGYEFLERTGQYSKITLNIIRHHHERYDGDGYPCGLKGDAISRSAQVAAICDVFCALTMDRIYRKACSQSEALTVMAEDAQKGAFNPEFFNIFADIIRERIEA